MARRKVQNDKVVVIASKVTKEHRDKILHIANLLGMDNLYQLLQSLLLFLLRSFDRQSDVSDEHEILLNAYLNTMISQKKAYSFMGKADLKHTCIKKAIIFVDSRKGEKPLILSITSKNNGKYTESYNSDEILKDVLSSLAPDVLIELEHEKKKNHQLTIIQALRDIIKRSQTDGDNMHDEIASLFTEEIDDLFEGLTIETFEELNDVHYKRKHKKNIDGVSSYCQEGKKVIYNKHLN